jgi:hypothetical protein
MRNAGSSMAKDQNNLGGAKARMRAGSRDLYVNYGTARKAGYYELCSQGRVVYRRVELPPWMTDVLHDPARHGSLLALIQGGSVRIPATASGERQGHIWFNPGGQLAACGPCVGVDEEIVTKELFPHKDRTLVFVCYEFGKMPVERWQITAETFLRHAVLCKPADAFEAQYFVTCSHLTFLRTG